MRASLRIAAVVVSALALVGSARAEVIDFNYSSTNGAAIVGGYGDTTFVTADYRVLSSSFAELGPMQWWTGSSFGHGPGGVMRDSAGDPAVLNEDESDVLPKYWGQVSLTLNDPVNYNLTLNSFVLCRPEDWSAPDAKLAVEIYQEGQLPTQLIYWTLSNNGQDAVVEVTPSPQALTKSVIIRWSFPYEIGIDDIDYSVTAVPEPATLITWVLGLASLGFVGYRRYRRASV